MFFDGKANGVGDGRGASSDREHKRKTPVEGEGNGEGFNDMDENWFKRGDRLSRRGEE